MDRLDVHWTESTFSPLDFIRARIFHPRSGSSSDRPITTLDGLLCTMYRRRTDSGAASKGFVLSIIVKPRKRGQGPAEVWAIRLGYGAY